MVGSVIVFILQMKKLTNRGFSIWPSTTAMKWASVVAQLIKNPPAMWETRV